MAGGIGNSAKGCVMTIIELPVEQEVADLYQRFSSQEQEKLGFLLGLWLRSFPDTRITLGPLMDSISEQAEARGLTPALLEDLLNE
jgi:hypothetical protein